MLDVDLFLRVSLPSMNNPTLQSVNRLAMETRRLVKGNHTRKTAAFIRACVAFCFITIPSLENVLSALNLYLLSGSVAIANGALSQGVNICTYVHMHMQGQL